MSIPENSLDEDMYLVAGMDLLCQDGKNFGLTTYQKFTQLDP
ncbi:MAG: hypothetical protein CM1200mP1_09640 [Candidatus Neomarinimicrobiota bacterium]|nr:MAG: hypothetical protein CM1200mP1_09640 [Candidatus Neomarinimicrobiota bacterium]